MTRQAKYLYWNKEDFYFITTELLPKQTKLPVVLFVGQSCDVEKQPIVLMQNNYDKVSSMDYDIVPIEIKTRKLLENSKIGLNDVQKVLQFIKCNEEFLLKIFYYDVDSLEIQEHLSWQEMDNLED